MHLTAELRWFWSEAAPPEWERWFGDEDAHGTVPETREDRTDEYGVAPGAEGETEIGVKSRGGDDGSGIEGKSLVAVMGELREGPFSGPVELWCKWTTEAAVLGPERVRVRKERRVRVYDTGVNGPPEPVPPSEVAERERAQGARLCHVELTRLTIDGEEDVAWTLAFEAASQAGEVARVREDLGRVVRMFAERRPPALAGALVASVPAWLAGRKR